MKIDPFLKCLSVTGIDTGVSLLGVYSFSSGTTGVIFNQLYSTGNNYYNGYPYRAALPLIYNGAGNQPSGTFDKTKFYQVADVFNSSFSALVYMNYSGCLNSGNVNYLVAATNPTNTASGVYLGISPANRLFVKSSGYAYTIPKEIEVGDFAFFNVTSNRFLNFGLFNVNENKYYGKSYDAGAETLEVKDLCFGGALSYPTTFTGYSGKMREIYLFSGTLDTGYITPCVDCSFASGYSTTSVGRNYQLSRITGSSWSGVSISGVTGTQKALMPYQLAIGGSGYVYYDSGVSGSILLYQALVPKTQVTTNTEYFSGFTFGFDNGPRMSGAVGDLYFDLGLASGDFVEVYTHPSFNSLVGLDLVGWDYPAYSGEVQLFGNGLAETSGVDYGVAFNNLITGFYEDDIMMYDLVPQTRSMEYITGANYIKTGLTTATVVRITGAYNVDFSWPFKHDIYLNGQKMASGVDYSIVQTGGSNVGIVSDPVGPYNDSFNDLNAANGDYLEIKFVPRTSGITVYQFPITNTIQYYVSGVTGFSEQVWVNGIRQKKVVDYVPTQRCRFCTGQFLETRYSFSLYDSELDTIGFFR